MSYIALHHCWNFCRNRTWFGEVIHEELSKGIQKLYFLLLWKPLKIYNLTTANATLMKRTIIMYLYETFHLTKDWSVTHRVYEGVNKKPLKMNQKISFLAQFLGTFNTKLKSVIYVMHYLTLRYRCKFQTNLVPCGGVTAKKYPEAAKNCKFVTWRPITNLSL